MNISDRVREKLLEKHGVHEEDIIECFATRRPEQVEDTRVKNRTNPPTWWFISETYYGKKLKVVFMQDANGGEITIKSAFPPNDEEIRIYNQIAPDTE